MLNLIRNPVTMLLGGGTTGGGSSKFYQCKSVDTDSGTWVGYKWVLDETSGIYVLSDEESTGLVIAGFTPIVGVNYSEDTLIIAGKFYTGPDPMPTDGLVFHASLASNAGVADFGGQTLTEEFNSNASSAKGISYTTLKGVPCAYFNGNSYIKFSDAGFPEGTEERTLSLWINIPNLNNTYTFFVYGTPDESGSNNDSGIGILWNYSSVVYMFSGRSGTADTPENSITAGTWHHLLYTLSSDSSVRGYIDGVLVATGSANQYTSTELSQGVIGKFLYNDFSYNGYLAGVRVYDKVLSMEEIELLASEFTPTA